jgi:hypothetical protein
LEVRLCNSLDDTIYSTSGATISPRALRALSKVAIPAYRNEPPARHPWSISGWTASQPVVVYVIWYCLKFFQIVPQLQFSQGRTKCATAALVLPVIKILYFDFILVAFMVQQTSMIANRVRLTERPSALAISATE